MTSDTSTTREDATPVAQPGTSPSKDLVRDRIALFEAMRQELCLPCGRSRRLSVPKQSVDQPIVRIRKMSVVEGPNIKKEDNEALPLSVDWPDEMRAATADSCGARYGMIFGTNPLSDVKKKEDELEEEEEKEEKENNEEETEEKAEGTDQTLRDWKSVRELARSNDDEAFVTAVKTFVQEIIQSAMTERNNEVRKSSLELQFQDTIKELQAMDEALEAVGDSEDKEVLRAPLPTVTEASLNPEESTRDSEDQDDEDDEVFSVTARTRFSHVPRITVSSDYTDQLPAPCDSDADEVPYHVVPTAHRAMMDDDNPYNVPSVDANVPLDVRCQSLGGYSADDSTSVSGESGAEEAKEECPYDCPHRLLFEEVPYDILPSQGPRNRTDTDVTLRKSPMLTSADEKSKLCCPLVCVKELDIKEV